MLIIETRKHFMQLFLEQWCMM